MALTAAVATGAVAAVAIPWLVEDKSGSLAERLSGRIVHIPLGIGFELHWSWLIFCVVTLAVWALLVAAKDR